MNDALYLDIETLPAQRPEILEEIRASRREALDVAIAGIKAPGNYGEEAAAKYMATKGAEMKEALLAGFDAEVDAEYRKTGLDGSFGQVCVVGWALADGEVQTLHHEYDEQWILHNFRAELAQAIRPADVTSTCVIGHNVSAFDLRFLVQRSIIRGIRPHPVIERAAMAKPWEMDRVFDTMVQWGGLKAGGSLDKLCKALSIPSPKGDITGATVWDAIKAGRIEEVAAYCARDVRAVRDIHARMTYRVPATVEVFEDVAA